MFQLWLIAAVKELLIATNPDPDSALAYLMRVPLGEGLVLRTAGTWPRTKALYCYPVPAEEWPTDPDIVERIPLSSCTRRGAAVDIVAARFRENRSQLVFTTARGRDAVFWQSPRTRKQARPQVALPTARAAGITELEIVVDAHERYAYRFAGQQARTTSRGLPCGDYGIVLDGALVAAVERKSLPDLISSLTGGRLRYALGELAALPRAAVVVEERYSQIYKHDRVRPALVADGIAECQILAQRPDRVLRDPRLGRGMDLPLPGRRLRLGVQRTGRGRANRRAAYPTTRPTTQDRSVPGRHS
jgi:ERCC4 domain